MFNVYDSWDSVQTQSAESRDELDLVLVSVEPSNHASATTYTLLKSLDIFHTDTNPSCASEMPAGLSGQVLYHDARKDCHLSLYVIQDAVIGEI